MAAEPEGEVVFRDGRLVITVDRNAPPPMAGYVVPGGNPLSVKPKRDSVMNFAPEDGVPSFDKSKATPELTRKAFEMAQELVDNKQYTEEEVKAGAMAADSTTFYMKALAGLLAESEAAPKAAAAPPTKAKTQPSKAPPLEREERADVAPYNLDIPDLYDTPTKPTELVVFELPGFGRHRARYHWVLVEDRLLLLVFDTRYDASEPYIPAVPADGKSFRLGLHDAHGNEAEAYYVQPVGTTIPFGCFLLILFVIDTVTDSVPTFEGFEPE